MKRFIQLCLLKIYALISCTGILRTSWFRVVFYTAYEWYKVFLEAGDVNSLKSYVKPGGVVIDIGANVGFFTKRFAKWVSDTGYVIALEPESLNFQQLVKNLVKEKTGTVDKVRAIQGVAAESNGSLKLEINPTHPGDHKIALDGVTVKAFTVDSLVQNEPDTRVCLIKIDVQGAEERVLLGARETIQRDLPAIFIELDDEALKRMGSSAERVIMRLTQYGYIMYELGNDDEISTIEALSMCRNGQYVDLLFIAAPDAGK
jgi:FkbM family methyltransferase